MEDNKKTIGDITVNMNDGNQVGHIGHQITFNEPPPSPNAIFQNGRVVGEMGSAPSLQPGKYLFEKLFTNESFREDQEFEVQGVRLQVTKSGFMTSASEGGRPPKRTYWNVICDIVSP